MTTISDELRTPAGVGVGGVTVRATLVAASEVLTGGGAIIRETETTTASDGTWSLTLTPISELAVSDGAYYLVTADGHRWTIDVPASGTYALDDVQVEPGPLPATGATTAALALRWRVALWDGSAYVDPGSGNAFARQPGEIVAFLGGPTDPTSSNGDLWIATDGAATGGGPLAAGERAGIGTVGYLGDMASLTVITQDGSLTGTPFAGVADWFPGVLVCNANTDLTIENYHFDGVSLFFSGNGNHTIRDCVIDGPTGQSYGLGSAQTTAEILVEDTTITFAGQGSAVGLTQFATIRRCDISGGENGLILYSMPAADFASAPTVSQCYIHGQLFDDVVNDHVDVIEVHQDPALATKLVIEHCYIAGVRGPGDVPISAGITMGQDSGTPGALTAKVDNCYIGDGTYHLRVEANTTGCVVTNNNFGALSSGEVGFAAVTTAGAITTWTNNRDGSGAAGTGTTVDNPNP
jgi:hypothetical protein